MQSGHLVASMCIRKIDMQLTSHASRAEQVISVWMHVTIYEPYVYGKTLVRNNQTGQHDEVLATSSHCFILQVGS
jgi:hypothetical protein